MVPRNLVFPFRKQQTEERQAKLDSMGPSVAWKIPEALSQNTAAPPLNVESNEVAVQLSRIGLVRPMIVLSDEDVPLDPTPPSAIEQSLETVSQSNAKPATIPFFVPKPEVTVNAFEAGIPVLAPAVAGGNAVHGASAEVVQAMGLPLFLVGCNIQALQTLASTPGLLKTFVNAQGHYDEVRLKTLVQTLSQTLNPSASQPALTPTSQSGAVVYAQSVPSFQNPPQQGQLYSSQPQSTGTASSTFTTFSATSTFQAVQKPMAQQIIKGGYRGDQNTTEGSNLHVSCYGPSATQEEILGLFAPYVHVVELVPKGKFSSAAFMNFPPSSSFGFRLRKNHFLYL